MKINSSTERTVLFSVTFFLTLIYVVNSLLINAFYSSDDWFHLRVSSISSISEFINFFSFSKTQQSIAFYRPLSTQVFFFIFQKLFDLNPTPYYLFIFICFGYLLYLLNQFIFKLTSSKLVSATATIIYGLSVSNFTRLFFLSAFQETALVIFSLLTLQSYLSDKKWRVLFFFVLALMSKETAVVIPALLILISWSGKKLYKPVILSSFAVLAIYLYLRLFIFGKLSGDTYTWVFSPFKTLNTLSWYTLWSFGAPEFLVDYVGRFYVPIHRLFSDFTYWWPFIIIPLITLIILATKRLFRLFLSEYKLIILSLFFYIISLGPVLFLPSHKFALELGLPLVGFSFLIASLFSWKDNAGKIFIGMFVAYNILMYVITYQTHYTINRGKIAKRVYQFIQNNYPVKPSGSYFEFINDTANYGKEWGSSKQIANSIGGSEMFRVIYKDPEYSVYFQDISGVRPTGLNKIEISTKKFL